MNNINLNFTSLSILLSICLFTSCSRYTQLSDSEKTEIVGVAKNAKAGAVIISDDNKIYYLKNVRHWKRKYLNKKIEITGDVVFIKGTTNQDSTIQSQNIPDRNVIINHKIQWVK